jgi:predicted porin
MFKKNLAVFAVAGALLAPVAVQADSKNVDIYGVVAYGWMRDKNVDDPTTVADEASNDWVINNETRIGFRGSRQFKNMASKFIWQIESGFIGEAGLGGATYDTGVLGARDTFGGFEGSFGKFRFGRLLTPFFETLDWPYANGGVGPIVESVSVVGGGNLTRHSNTFRWDSPGGGMVTGGVSFGRGFSSVAESQHLSAMVNIKAGPATVHVGFEKTDKMTATSDATNTLIGFELPLGGGFSIYGVMVNGSADHDNGDEYERSFMQFAGVYGTGDWIFKLTTAMNDDQELNGSQFDEGGTLTAVQALYILDPSAVAYVRYVTNDEPTTTAAWGNRDNRILIGMEYYF